MAHQAYHLLVDVLGIPPEKVSPLSSPGEMWAIMEAIREAVGMKLLTEPFYVYAEGQGKAWGPGVSGISLVTDSHLSIHALKEERALHFDLFSCAAFDADLVYDMLERAFGGRLRRLIVDRSEP